MTDRRVGVLGATSYVGDCLLEMLADAGWETIAFSRRPNDAPGSPARRVQWRQLPDGEIGATAGGTARDSRVSPVRSGSADKDEIKSWVSLAPIVSLGAYLPMLESHGARRVVALSSTSRFTKATSSDPSELDWANRMIDAEERLMSWSRDRGIEWIILRPTLIYGLGRDRNVSVIAGFVSRFGFFPLLGKAEGLRQPVHARDVAKACYEMLESPIRNRAYTISGAETMSYREMVARVFDAVNRPVRFIVIPTAAFRLGFTLLKLLPRYRYLSLAMAERMNQDLAFDHADASRDFGFSPSPFRIEGIDLPKRLVGAIDPQRT